LDWCSPTARSYLLRNVRYGRAGRSRCGKRPCPPKPSRLAEAHTAGGTAAGARKWPTAHRHLATWLGMSGALLPPKCLQGVDMINLTFSAYLTSWPNENAARNNLRVQLTAVHYRIYARCPQFLTRGWGGLVLPCSRNSRLHNAALHWDYEHKSHGSPLHTPLHNQTTRLATPAIARANATGSTETSAHCANYTVSRAWRQLSQQTLPSFRTRTGEGTFLAEVPLIILRLSKFHNSAGTSQGQ
jgi:hypothetical protein